MPHHTSKAQALETKYEHLLDEVSARYAQEVTNMLHGLQQEVALQGREDKDNQGLQAKYEQLLNDWCASAPGLEAAFEEGVVSGGGRGGGGMIGGGKGGGWGGGAEIKGGGKGGRLRAYYLPRPPHATWV